MDKLKLIIPISKFTSSPLIKLILVGLLCLISIYSNAQVYGCHVLRGGTEVLYYLPYPAGGVNAYITTGTVDATGAEGGFRNNGSVTYGCIRDIGAPCTVYQQYLLADGVTVATRVFKTGFYAEIAPINCLIDDNTLLLVIFTACLGFLKIKSRPT